MKRLIAGIIAVFMFLLTTTAAIIVPLELSPLNGSQVTLLLTIVFFGYMTTALYAAVYFNKL